MEFQSECSSDITAGNVLSFQLPKKRIKKKILFLVIDFLKKEIRITMNWNGKFDKNRIFS
ncbi:hypothetical protein PGB90_002661 [Kerria lacca]